MKICRLKRPWLSPFWKEYPQRGDHIFGHIRQSGQEVVEQAIVPLSISNPYLSYGAGMIRSLSHLKKLRPSLAVAEDMEKSSYGKYLQKVIEEQDT